ncbi:Malonyl-coenzyme A:anthocyanin 3-O-glucoside-6''-O-malonyltransferase [Sesamum alatum]|uniref:Malonyl-coenzyme A:anthocyanin 3-O-glucoside-6''-O-malonyltransferase n=1 Tax=Sesamum alatum TaxID=300844 RepID=A0AAE2CRC1_9LAMI|nr:Malonyl-coenzyme A:anthocyanin 3-O-glucoside-6''-O-malonyltransferase [Sesamum alatum]
MVPPSQSLDNPESAHHQERPLASFQSPAVKKTKVGEDAHGKLIAEALEGGGVLLDHLSIVSDAPTGHAVVMLQADGQNSIIIVGGANMASWLETLPPEDLEHRTEIRNLHGHTSRMLSNLTGAGLRAGVLTPDCIFRYVSESTADFNHLTGNDPRVCDEFYAFAPRLPAATYSETSISFPVLALQVTLFPGQGLCIGFVTNHAVANASKFYDRKTMTNLNGLDEIYWDVIVDSSCTAEPPSVELPINKLRATFFFKKEEIQRLKNFVSAKCPSIDHLSSFTIICALVWVCTAKSAHPSGEDVADDESEYFDFVADCRRRLNPPLPANISATVWHL